MYDATNSERRLTRRAPVRCTARLLRGAQTGAQTLAEHPVVNLSVGGARLLGAPLSSEHRATRIALALPHTPLELCAHVVRIDGRDKKSFAIEFDWLTPEQEDAIHRAVLGALLPESSRRAGVLVVDAMPTSRSAVAHALSVLGHSVVPAATPLEAVMRLREQAVQPLVTFFSASSAQGVSGSLIGVLRDTYPSMQLVVLSAEGAQEQAIAAARAFAPGRGRQEASASLSLA